MGRFRKTFHFESPVEDVWDLMCDADRLTEWNKELVEVRDVTGPLDMVGSRYTQVMRLGWIKAKGHWEVTKVEPLRRREFYGSPPGCVYARGTDTYRDAEGGTDLEVELAYKVRGGILGDVADRMFGRRMLERTLERNAQRLSELL